MPKLNPSWTFLRHYTKCGCFSTSVPRFWKSISRRDLIRMVARLEWKSGLFGPESYCACQFRVNNKYLFWGSVETLVIPPRALTWTCWKQRCRLRLKTTIDCDVCVRRQQKANFKPDVGFVVEKSRLELWDTTFSLEDIGLLIAVHQCVTLDNDVWLCRLGGDCAKSMLFKIKLFLFALLNIQLFSKQLNCLKDIFRLHSFSGWSFVANTLKKHFNHTSSK